MKGRLNRGKPERLSSASFARVKSSAHLVNMHILTPRNALLGTSSFILLDFPWHGISNPGDHLTYFARLIHSLAYPKESLIRSYLLSLPVPLSVACLTNEDRSNPGSYKKGSPLKSRFIHALAQHFFPEHGRLSGRKPVSSS